jgi:CBS domain containing-hemolysin-like protein
VFVFDKTPTHEANMRVPACLTCLITNSCTTYSIPVYGADSHDIVGLILTKDLIFIDPEDETPLKNFVHIFGRQLQYVWPTQSLGEVLKMFKQGHGHMAIVRDTVDDGQV